ncbi:MAG TPA: hypothetical protein VHM00_10265 [Caldimonas sp.]|jgi:hypothetical protein|nr:hypothetical protein [Caldimonas sp.]HEX2541453.1 hypothetical protein [Caldimonas sp.]
MQAKLIVAIAVAALAGAAQAQTTGSTAREAARDTGAAAKAAVTPGDQNMGRTPNNRSGGVMGNDQPAGAAGRAAEAAVTPGDQNMGRTPNNRSGGVMGTDRTRTDAGTTSGTLPARADRN